MPQSAASCNQVEPARMRSRTYSTVRSDPVFTDDVGGYGDIHPVVALGVEPPDFVLRQHNIAVLVIDNSRAAAGNRGAEIICRVAMRSELVPRHQLCTWRGTACRRPWRRRYTAPRTAAMSFPGFAVYRLSESAETPWCKIGDMLMSLHEQP